MRLSGAFRTARLEISSTTNKQKKSLLCVFASIVLSMRFIFLGTTFGNVMENTVLHTHTHTHNHTFGKGLNNHTREKEVGGTIRYTMFAFDGEIGMDGGKGCRACVPSISPFFSSFSFLRRGCSWRASFCLRSLRQGQHPCCVPFEFRVRARKRLPRR